MRVDDKLMESLEDSLNDLLVKMFKNVMEIEAKWLITEDYKDISNNDMHIIEAIGVEEPQKSSVVAQKMSITMGTLTKAIDALTRKGYVDRRRGTSDKRVVKLSLTEKGRAAFYHHEQFHRQMIENLKSGLNEQELTVLIYALAKLEDYFNGIYYEEDEDKQFESWENINETNS